MDTEANLEFALVSHAEFCIQHRTAEAYTDGAAPGSDSGATASFVEASPETSAS